MKRIVLFALTLALAACSDGRVDIVSPDASEPLLNRAGGAESGYIVVLREGARPEAVAAIAGVRPSFLYRAALNGFAAELNQGQLTALRNNPNVDYIETDGVATITATQSNATWGIDRTDQRDLPLSRTYSYTTTASNVRAYIIDTGIRTDHTEFGGRAQMVFNSAGGKNTDCNGHGTHVAGTVGGSTYGIAKQVQLYGVKVLGCSGSGTWSGVIAGMDWVVANHPAGQPGVANLSLGGSRNQAVNDAATRLASVVTVAVAAGNNNIDACNYSPAGATDVITVAASTSADAKAGYSNWGSCVELYAPGSSITSAWHTNARATNTISGTSMASPHVAGVAALYLAGGAASSVVVTNWLITNSTLNKITGNITGTPNRLLFKSTL